VIHLRYYCRQINSSSGCCSQHTILILHILFVQIRYEGHPQNIFAKTFKQFRGSANLDWALTVLHESEEAEWNHRGHDGSNCLHFVWVALICGILGSKYFFRASSCLSLNRNLIHHNNFFECLNQFYFSLLFIAIIFLGQVRSC
jgi:hypothetical protein